VGPDSSQILSLKQSIHAVLELRRNTLKTQTGGFLSCPTGTRFCRSKFSSWLPMR